MSERDLTTADIAEPQRQEEERRTDDDLRDRADGEEQGGEERRELLQADDTAELRQRWEALQVGFVDEPRQSVEQADALVADLMQRLAKTFAEERSNLESQWDSGDDVSTEDLRVALQRYRSFFDRLLSA